MIKISNSDLEKIDVYFTADTHFGSARTYGLSQRDRIFGSIDEMDIIMVTALQKAARKSIRNGKKPILFHLGDIGNIWNINEINDLYKKIYLITGNYEENDDFTLTDEDLHSYGITKVFHKKVAVDFGGMPIALAHKPTDCKKLIENTDGCKYGLFGHTHGRQMVKSFGIDVGVDAQLFAPISLDDAKFLLNAIDKGYYDQDVWCQ